MLETYDRLILLMSEENQQFSSYSHTPVGSSSSCIVLQSSTASLNPRRDPAERRIEGPLLLLMEKDSEDRSLLALDVDILCSLVDEVGVASPSLSDLKSAVMSKAKINAPHVNTTKLIRKMRLKVRRSMQHIPISYVY